MKVSTNEKRERKKFEPATDSAVAKRFKSEFPFYGLNTLVDIFIGARKQCPIFGSGKKEKKYQEM